MKSHKTSCPAWVEFVLLISLETGVLILVSVVSPSLVVHPLHHNYLLFAVPGTAVYPCFKIWALFI